MRLDAEFEAEVLGPLLLAQHALVTDIGDRDPIALAKVDATREMGTAELLRARDAAAHRFLLACAELGNRGVSA